jgi:2-polyprenyl-3-methyl-5-hydroxy-6-metoxy-1,4-benzoquinol methylase
MKIAQGLRDDGVVAGNVYDKYGSEHLIVRKLMKGFETALTDLVRKAGPTSLHEVGCGEGYWVLKWQQEGIVARGSDVSSRIIDVARANAIEREVHPSLFQAKSIYALDSEQDEADLVVCCEVLEHLERPEDGLRALQRVTGRYLILSVPREPLWRAMNLARGKYVTALGNTPGHLQHWSKSGFIKMASRYFEVVEIKTPLPWTMILCRQQT